MDEILKMLEEKYSPIIEGALSSIMGKEISLVIETMEIATESVPNTQKAGDIQEKIVPQEPAKDQFQSHLNPKYIFENFYVTLQNHK